MSLIHFLRFLIAVAGIVWVLSVVGCYVMMYVLYRVKFDWREMGPYSAPYRPKVIIRVSSWIPFVNTRLVFSLWELYKCQREQERDRKVTQFERYRRRM